MRKAFNFYRSYYEVAKELSEKDRAAFLWALIEKQFEGKEPNLSGLASFAYLSQKHSIDMQVIGFETKTKTKLDPCQGGTEGGCQAPSVQEKEKGKEKGKENNNITASPKPKKVFFKDSEIFDKNIFASKFQGWNQEKLRYYYEAALRYSNEGNKYVDWAAAVSNWAKKDELTGKISFKQPPKVVLSGIV